VKRNIVQIKDFKIISITHQHCSLEQVGLFHVEESLQEQRFGLLREQLGLSELMYNSTCNRVEFLFFSKQVVDKSFLDAFYSVLFDTNIPITSNQFAQIARVYEGHQAVRHIFLVSASLDSMVVGEREIITQVRDSFERSRKMGLSGDGIRLVMRKTIETAKKVYTDTSIAHKPVSVVSLAYKYLRDLNIDLNARILMVGAGKTNRTMSKFLLKHGYRNFIIYNRTLANAQLLASELNGIARPLSELANHAEGFDVLFTCTASSEPVISASIYEQLINGETGKKVIIDLAVPNDVAPELTSMAQIRYVEVATLQIIARENLKLREKEIEKCLAIIDESMMEFDQMFHERQIERALGAIPVKIKEIKENAMNEVFARDLSNMDDASKETLLKVMDYFEKKYIGLPMKMAKEILVESRQH
jgi:glutamyl-tRNA reductase